MNETNLAEKHGSAFAIVVSDAPLPDIFLATTENGNGIKSEKEEVGILVKRIEELKQTDRKGMSLLDKKNLTNELHALQYQMNRYKKQIYVPFFFIVVAIVLLTLLL